jgi:hypothetical protein
MEGVGLGNETGSSAMVDEAKVLVATTTLLQKK